LLITLLTSSFSSTIVKMAEGIKIPPKFDGLNFSIWKAKMTMFLQSLGSRVAKAVTKPFSAPVGDEDTWSDIATKKLVANVKAHNALLQVLNNDDIARVIHCKSDYGIWSHLVVIHEGTSQVKRDKLIFCVPNMRILLCMKNDSIDDMVTKFT